MGEPVGCIVSGKFSDPEILQHLLRLNWHRSILRRASGLLLLLLPGFVLNYALVLGASRMLEVDSFGIFYTSISIVNLFFMPAVIVGTFFVYDVAQAAARGGAAEAFGTYRRQLVLTARWGLVLSVVLIAAFSGVSVASGTTAWLLFAIIVITTYSSYFVECLRSYLQGTQRFSRLGAIGLSWMAGRFLLGLIGIYAAGTAWGGMAGVAMAGILVFVFANRTLFNEHPGQAIAPVLDRETIRRLLVFVASYGVFPIAAYLDILLAYFVLPGDSLGAYAAASVLPKAFILAAAPIVQVMFPVLISDRVEARGRRGSVAKGLLFTMFFAGAAVTALVLLDDLVCGGSVGVKNCLDDLLLPLGLSSAALCVIRVLVLHKLAEGLYRQSLLLLLVPALAFTVVTMYSPQTPEILAVNFCIFCGATLVIYCLSSIRSFSPAALLRR